MRRSLVSTLAILLVGTGAAAATTHGRMSQEGRPTLILSIHRGGPGTLVRLKGINCPPLLGQRDELTWHISYQVAHRFAGYRRVHPLRRVGSKVTATFRVLRSDHRGKGVLDLFCGGSGGNAVGYFVVTR